MNECFERLHILEMLLLTQEKLKLK